MAAIEDDFGEDVVASVDTEMMDRMDKVFSHCQVQGRNVEERGTYLKEI